MIFFSDRRLPLLDVWASEGIITRDVNGEELDQVYILGAYLLDVSVFFRDGLAVPDVVARVHPGALPAMLYLHLACDHDSFHVFFLPDPATLQGSNSTCCLGTN